MATAINTLHVQLAYAAQKGVGWGVLATLSAKAASKSGAARVMAWGLGALFIPVYGEFALIVASIISAGLIINDVAGALHESSKSGLDSLFHAYQDEISNSKVPLLNKHCHEMYSDQIAEDAQDLFDDIKGLGHDSWWEPGSWSFQWGNLCWRAVVPLHVKGFPIQLIESLVTLPDTLTETTRSQHRSTAKGYYKTVASAQDILTFYEEMLNADAAATMPSGTPKHVIAEALTDGTSLC